MSGPAKITDPIVTPTIPSAVKTPPSTGITPVPSNEGTIPANIPRPPGPTPVVTPSTPNVKDAPQPSTDLFNTNTIIALSVIGLLLVGVGYYYFGGTQTSSFGSRAGGFILYGTITLLLGLGGYFIWASMFGDSTQSSNLASTPVTSASSTVVPGTQAPPQSGDKGGDYGIQWWMYINDWNYKFGQRKPVITRGSDNVYNPNVYLHPTENTLCVEISVFPSQSSTRGSEPAPVGSDGSATDSSFTCTVTNVPLQKWFAVGVSVSGRNVDIYLDGLLVRSCVLPGVPQPSNGNLQLMTGGGFSGSVVDLYHYSRGLVPEDARAFAAAGTNATATNALPSKSFFGYTVKLGVVDNSGNEIKNYVF